MKDNDSNTEVELFVRSLTPDGAEEQQEKVINRLEELDDSDVIDEFRTYVWGKQICVPMSSDGGDIKSTSGESDMYREFIEWSEENGVTLAPFFQERESVSRDSRVIVFPVMCLCVYEDGDLKNLYPHIDLNDRRSYSVNDALDLLEDDSEEVLLA